MCESRHEQLDLFAWADSIPTNVIDGRERFWHRKLDHAWQLNFIRRGKIPAPEAKAGELLEVRFG